MLIIEIFSHVLINYEKNNKTIIFNINIIVTVIIKITESLR